jgi:hypothetical protein
VTAEAEDFADEEDWGEVEAEAKVEDEEEE